MGQQKCWKDGFHRQQLAASLLAKFISSVALSVRVWWESAIVSLFCGRHNASATSLCISVQEALMALSMFERAPRMNTSTEVKLSPFTLVVYQLSWLQSLSHYWAVHKRQSSCIEKARRKKRNCWWCGEKHQKSFLEFLIRFIFLVSWERFFGEGGKMVERACIWTPHFISVSFTFLMGLRSTIDGDLATLSKVFSSPSFNFRLGSLRLIGLRFGTLYLCDSFLLC